MLHKLIDRSGETIKTNRCGNCTILVYRNARSIDVIFTDGTIVKERKYGDFKNDKTNSN